MKKLENIEQDSTSSRPPPDPFCKPSAYSDVPEAEHTENIEHTALPTEPFPEPEPQPSTSSGITRTPAKT